VKSVDEQIDDIFEREGKKYHDVPGDRGGPTGAGGISLRYARGIGLDLDGDGDVDKDDIMLVTLDVARELYKRDFFYGPMISSLPVDLHPQMFDTAIPSGPPMAIILLQRTLNRRFGCNLTEDGRMGKNTRRAAETACTTFGWVRVNNDLVEVRKAFFHAIVARDASQTKFLSGWLKRAESFRVRA